VGRKYKATAGPYGLTRFSLWALFDMYYEEHSACPFGIVCLCETYWKRRHSSCSRGGRLALQAIWQRQNLNTLHHPTRKTKCVVAQSRLLWKGGLMPERSVLFEHQAVRVVATHLQFISCKLVTTARWNFVIIINCIWVVTRGSGYFTCIQNMKLVNKILKWLK